MIDKRMIQHTAIDALLLFFTVLPSIFRIKSGILSFVIFIIAFLILSAAAVISANRIFTDGEKSFWKALLPFSILSVIANFLFGIVSTFPFIVAAVTVIFAKKITVLKKNAYKTKTSVKFHPYFTVYFIILAAYTALYSIAGVL